MSLLKLYISVRGNQLTLKNLEYTVLGSVVDMYSVPWLNNLCHVLELEELTLACLLTLSNLVIYSILSIFC